MKKKDYASYYVEQKKSDRYCDPFFILKLKKKLFFFFEELIYSLDLFYFELEIWSKLLQGSFYEYIFWKNA